MQTRKLSILEAITNTLVGFLISLALVNVVLPMYGFDINFTQSVSMTIIFSIASIIRGYIIRRFYHGFSN